MKLRKWIKNNINPIVVFALMIGFAREHFNFANPIVIVSLLILSVI